MTETKPQKKIVYVDMDGVLVDFDRAVRELPDDMRKRYKSRYDHIDGFFFDMKPIDGALEAFARLWEHFDVYILSCPSIMNPSSYTDKFHWVKRYLPYAIDKLILSRHKQLNLGDYLIDDRTKHGAAEFTGKHIHFGKGEFMGWPEVLEYLLKENYITMGSQAQPLQPQARHAEAPSPDSSAA